MKKEAALLSIKARNGLLQAMFMLVLVGLLGGFLITLRTNLTEQGITSGFSFLWRSTSWDMGFSFLSFDIRDPYWYTLTLGFLNTIIIGYIALILATFIGVGLASMRIYGNRVLNFIALVYVDLIRNVPPILQVFSWYALFTAFPAPRRALQFADNIFITARGIYLPSLNISGGAIAGIILIFITVCCVLLWIGFFRSWSYVPFKKKAIISGGIVLAAFILTVLLVVIGRLPGVDLISKPALKGFNFQGGYQIPPEMMTILFSTMVYGSAYIAEIIRGGFLSVDRGKIEGARALGLSNWMIFSRVRLPLTVRNILPMMTNVYVWLIKATTLGIAVGFSDLFMVVISSINQSGQTMEFILILAAAFYFLNSGVVWSLNRVNESIKIIH